jgi:hypothetical protein
MGFFYSFLLSNYDSIQNKILTYKKCYHKIVEMSVYNFKFQIYNSPVKARTSRMVSCERWRTRALLSLI